MVGSERVLVNSAGDWGKSNPLAVPEFIQEMKRRGHSEAAIRKVVYDNPLAFFRQANRWQEPDLPGAEVGKASAPAACEDRKDKVRGVRPVAAGRGD
jgi:hypothetical protein